MLLPRLSSLSEQPWPTIGLVLVHMWLGGIALSYYMNFLPLALANLGASPLMIGINSGAASLSIIVLTLCYGTLLERLGYRRLMLLGGLVVLIGMCALALGDNFYWWTGWRLVVGFGVGLGWLGCENWLSQITPAQYRGRVMSLYVGLFLLGMATGPLLLPYFGLNAFPSLLVPVVIEIVAIIVLWPCQEQGDRKQERLHLDSARLIYQKAGPLVITALIIGLMQGIAMTMTGYHATLSGYDLATASLRNSLYMAGGLAIQWPLASFADKLDRPKIIGLLAIIILITMVVLPTLNERDMAVLPYQITLIIYGAAAFAQYTLLLALIGDKFHGSQHLAAANSIIILFWEFGSMISGPVTGLAMNLVGPIGYFTIQQLAATLLIIFVRRI